MAGPAVEALSPSPRARRASAAVDGADPVPPCDRTDSAASSTAPNGSEPSYPPLPTGPAAQPSYMSLSELLAVAAVAILSVYLRRRGSPEAKPVGAPHTCTGVEGWARKGMGAVEEQVPAPVDADWCRWVPADVPRS